MSAAWLTYPLELDSSRAFDCGSFTPEQCKYYSQRWHFWYVKYQADHVFALPTVAFFMCAIGIFIIARLLMWLLSFSRVEALPAWRRTIAGFRYMSYRGFYIKALGWGSPPIGLLTLAATGAIFFLCMDLIPMPYYWPDLDWGNSPPLATRSGWMALACMPFVFATASKANWITLLTGVSHEKLQMFHRWISYAFFILALMHTFPFIVYHVHNHDMVEQVSSSATLFYWTGIVALIFQAWLTFASFGPFRGLGYEFFKAAHLFSVVIFVIVFFWHCDYTLTSWDYFVATAAVYVPCFVYPWLRTCFEYGLSQKAEVHVEENGFICLKVPACFEWAPGQHCFLRFHSFGISALTSHPFTICSLPSHSPNEQSHLTFYIRHRGGFTARLHNYALSRPGTVVPVLIDGPYGGVDLHTYINSDRLLVIAGGSGAGWVLPLIEQTVRYNVAQLQREDVRDIHLDDKKYSKDKAGRNQHGSARHVSLRAIFATRDFATRIWFRKTIHDLLSRYASLHELDDLDVHVYLTGEAGRLEELSEDIVDLERSGFLILEEGNTTHPSEAKRRLPVSGLVDVQEQHGRPHLPLIIQEESAQTVGNRQSLGVFVCGPDTMQDDVRNAVAKENLHILRGAKSGGIYLHMEHFSWA
ncbi:putative ferric-chelate reductase [Polychaeton citri CBS 116435]|uniref:ferric-chelate reductase (NADPH) n=1 Tax=Polychaeton citri CBS 116435 TaxID=1314669 RepID=A0A9P4Q731_9PEZI|nr:putative ferric-chelate reductase [Polychaeton citri CBS 116435]